MQRLKTPPILQTPASLKSKSALPLGLAYLRAILKNPLQFLLEATKDKTIVGFTIGRTNIFLLNHPDYVQEVLVSNQKNFDKGKNVRWLKQLLGEGLLTSEGDLHLLQRRLMQPLFHRAYIANFSATIIHYSLQAVQERWVRQPNVNMHQELLHLTRKIIAKVVLNVDLDTSDHQLNTALEAIVGWAGRGMLPLSIAELLDRLPLPKTRKFREAQNYIDQLLYTAISLERTRIRNAVQDIATTDNLLTLLVQAQEQEFQAHGANTRLADKQVRDELLTLFLAGHNTVTQMLGWTCYLLAKHSAIQEKLYAEIEQVLQGAIPTAADMAKLEYTNAVLTEALRLYPPAYVIIRNAIEACQVGNYAIPAKSFVIPSPYVLHNNPRYYPEPEEFKPERWLAETKTTLPKYAYFPFGGGPRLCIGEPLARMEGVLLLTLFIQKWQMHLDPNQIVRAKPKLTLHPGKGIWLKLTPRN